MSIQEDLKKLNPMRKDDSTQNMPVLQENYGIWGIVKSQDFFIATVLVLVALIAFGLGRLSVMERNSKTERIETPRIEPQEKQIDHETASLGASAASASEEPIKQELSTEGYVASKNGTKYHLPWCPGAGQIKDENKIWFKTKAEAESAGYSPASNCKGI